jgi:hypothetical protein
MNINFSIITIRRAIMHQIVAKEPKHEHATVQEETHLFELTEEVKKTIKKRLGEAAAKESKAFEVEVAEVGPGTFFDYTSKLKAKSDAEFIEASKQIAQLLATNSRRPNIPGGYLILLDCTNKSTNQGLYIVIKADLHEALAYSKKTRGRESNIDLLTDVFLSPSQKLFKIGILMERKDPETKKKHPNNLFVAYLFDDQFRADSKPAEYFYKEFLGFTVDKNSKIQSKRFYDKTANFIKENFEDYRVQSDLLKSLTLEFTVKTAKTMTPTDFSKDNFPDEFRDKYLREVANDLPATFVKDDELIKTALTKKKISFPSEVNLSGPAEGFDDHVQFIGKDEIRQLRYDPSVTLVRIQGKPYQHE